MENVIETLASELAIKIESAFDGVPFPGVDHPSLSQAEAWDSYNKCDQSKDFKGKWQDIPIQDFRENQWAIPHLDAHGFIFYLPALMLAIVKNKNIGNLIGESVLLSLAHESKNPQLALLNDSQLGLVKDFVDFCSLREDSKLC